MMEESQMIAKQLHLKDGLYIEIKSQGVKVLKVLNDTVLIKY